MNDISNNIKKVLFIFLVCFMALVSYITYFEIFEAPKIVNSSLNKRTWVKRNEVLRGTIYDRNKKALTKSERINELSQKRTYTGGAVFAHALGYVDVRYGITGLENKYDSELMANDSENFFNFFNLKRDNSKKEKFGHDLITTLDYNLQNKAYDLLGDNKGAVVALNPKTGDILAMVSKPSFDPNDLKSNWASLNSSKNTDYPMLNRAVSGLYPPGSTFKTITAISALDNISGIQNETFHDTGRLVFNSKESLSNFGGEVLGNINFKQGYEKSSNFVFGTIGLKLGNDNLRTTAEKFFFNKSIPADGIVIDHSKFPTLKSYQKGDMAQSAIGQSSVLATPMQMALVASTIANNGVMMKPHIVNQVINNKGEVVKDIQPESLGQIISTQDSATMKEFMRGVVTEGTGTVANIQGVEVCGKTGTADHSDNGSKQPHSWFIAFAPKENPQIALAVIVENGGQGATAAGNVAAGVLKAAFNK